jgi:hypothetical protein
LGRSRQCFASAINVYMARGLKHLIASGGPLDLKVPN